MSIDTRLKRQSATCILVPSMLSGVYPDTAEISKAERQAVAWIYSGIEASEGQVIISGINVDDGKFYRFIQISGTTLLIL